MNLSQHELRRKRLYTPLPLRYTTYRSYAKTIAAALLLLVILTIVLS